MTTGISSIDFLNQIRERLNESAAHFRDDNFYDSHAFRDVLFLLARIEKLERALQFYADCAGIPFNHGREKFLGDIAREALEQP